MISNDITNDDIPTNETHMLTENMNKQTQHNNEYLLKYYYSYIIFDTPTIEINNIKKLTTHLHYNNYTHGIFIRNCIIYRNYIKSIQNRYAVSVRWERENAAELRRRRGEPPLNSSSSGPITEAERPCLTFTIEDFNRYFCCCARRVGSMFFLIERKDGSPIIVAGPCWPFCTFVTVPLIVVCSTLVGIFIVSNPNTGLVSSMDST